jgi:hypothetical protein
MITVEIKESKVVVKEFPKLMKLIGGHRVVLFSNRNTGTCIVDFENPEDVGEYCDDYVASYYEDFNSELILKND